MDTIKTLSDKPILVTMRDAAILMVVVLVITLICTWLYYKLFPANGEPIDWKFLILKTSAASLMLTFIYEYGGINSMLAESSLRYAKGSTLNKYKSAREMMLYECFYNLSGDQSSLPVDVTISDINHNMRVLKWIVSHPNACGKLADTTNTDTLKSVVEKLTIADPESAIIITEIAGLDPKVIKNINSIGDRITENIAYFLLVNGLKSFQDLISAEALGAEISKKYDVDDINDQ